MTENEVAKKNLETLERFYRIAKSGSALHEVLSVYVTLEDLVEAIQALEEIQAYRAIGTIDEFKALKEKNEPKKPTIKRVNYSHNQYADDYKCPVCGQRMISKDKTGWYSGRRSKYCDNCGQKLDWQ